MGDALNLIYYCFSKFLVLFFDTFELFSNVTIGWILVSIFILGIMISNILSAARNSSVYSSSRSSDRELWRKNKTAQTDWYNKHM